MCDEGATYATSLLSTEDIGVSNKINVGHGLNSHHTDQLTVDFVAPEPDAICDFALERLERHVGLVPAVARNGFAIRLRGFIHDRENPITFVVAAKSNAAHVQIDAAFDFAA